MKGAGKIRAIGCCLILSMALVLWTFDYAAAPVKYRLGTGDVIDFTAVTKSNQGVGSGLDADTVDGKHASDLVASGVGGIKDTDIDWGLSTGQVNTDDIPEGAANKYFSGKTTDNLPEGSANKYFSGKTTTNLPEGSNLYYTDARFDTRLATKTTDNLTEGTTNKYFSGKTTDNLPEGTTNKYNPFGVTIDSSEITDGTIANADISATAAIARSKIDFGTGLVNNDISATAAITESKLSLNYATHSNANDPIASEKAALAGTFGTPSGTNKYVTDTDARNTNARTPTAHASTHVSGGADTLSGNLDAVARVTVRKNTGADTGSRRRLNIIEGTGTTLTITDDPTNEEVDVTIASSGGTNPSFSVHKNGVNQTGVATATWTKLTWPTEEFDTNNNFAADKFTPTVAGKYLLTAWVQVYGYGFLTGTQAAIYKNGSMLYEPYAGGGVSVIIDANGSTDYFEVYTYHATGNTESFHGAQSKTYFHGCKVD